MEHAEAINNSAKKGKKLALAAGLTLFIVLALLAGARHEPWADEAQSWLIARDASIIDIFSIYARYEGTPALWHIILKLLILFGLKHEYLFLVPVFFSSVGVFLFLYKSNFPLIFRIVFPFTYFILYQYTIFARSYCLVLPALCFVAIMYRARHEKPQLYAVSLLVLSQISAHTALIAGMLFLIFGGETVCVMLKEHTVTRHIGEIVACGILAAAFLLTLLYIAPPSDLQYNDNLLGGDSGSVEYYIVNFLYVIGNGLLASQMQLIPITISLVLISLLLLFLRKNHVNTLYFVLILLPMLLFMTIVYCSGWHYGFVFVVLVFLLWIICDEPLVGCISRKNAPIYVILLIISCVQLYWSGTAMLNDVSGASSQSEQAAQLIADNMDEDTSIFGLGFDVVAVNQYFDSNIFDNFNSELSLYNWSTANGYLTDSEMANANADIVVLGGRFTDDYPLTVQALKSGDYKVSYFCGDIFYKDTIFLSESFYVYIKE